MRKKQYLVPYIDVSYNYQDDVLSISSTEPLVTGQEEVEDFSNNWYTLT